MIQRIQSLLLAGVLVLLILNFITPVWSGWNDTLSVHLNVFMLWTSSGTTNMNQDFYRSEATYYIAILLVVAIFLTLFTIFKYKDRALQLRMCSLLLINILITIGAIFLAIRNAKSYFIGSIEDSYGVGYYLPLISCVLVFAARYFIKKDDDLVKSVDRLR